MFSKSNRRRRIGAIVLSTALIASACGGSATTDVAATTAPTEPATERAEAPASSGGPGLPQLVSDTLSGAQIDTNELAGQDVIVWFWAPW